MTHTVNEHEMERELVARMFELKELYNQMTVIESESQGAMEFLEGLFAYLNKRHVILHAQMDALRDKAKERQRRMVTNPATMRAASISLAVDNETQH